MATKQAMKAALVFLYYLFATVEAFAPLRPSSISIAKQHHTRQTHGSLLPLQSVAVSVPASELDKDLSEDERSVVSVVRANGPSVAFVTSVLPLSRNTENRSYQRQRRRAKPQQPQPEKDAGSDFLPPGRTLGSGSAFVVDSRGYLVTNYHVVEQAYSVSQMASQIDHVVDEIAGNLTKLFPALDVRRFVKEQRQQQRSRRPPLPEVYVRIDSATTYQKCQFVDVRPELDIAVLQVLPSEQTNTTTTAKSILTPVEFGESGTLLQGQRLIAIGNPFGLDNTVTTGVVSALNREIKTTRIPIRNCIQTDCAINPGSSGGPLLNLRGLVVGVNTAIVTTSGSNAGVGFAVPSDEVRPVVTSIIQTHVQQQQSKQFAFLGVTLLRINEKKATLETTQQPLPLLWVRSVQPNSPAQRAGIRGLELLSDSSVVYGDAIVAVAGNAVGSYQELQADLTTRSPGEKLSFTLEDGVTGERRVAYVELVGKSSA